MALLGVALGAALAALWLLGRRLARSQASLARSESGWVQALDFAEDAMYLIDLDDRLVRGNKAFYRYLGRKPGDVIGEPVMRLMHGADEARPCPVCQARRDRRDAVFVKEADDPVNRLGRPIEIVVKTIRGAGGEPIGVLQVLRDLSRQRLAEQAIRESEARYRILSQAAFDGIAVHDGGKVVAFNPTLARHARLCGG
ncbi:MAG: PAS domain-containing protein [Comamonadaceae bacterium]|nr:PAS domain-containing protein [Comamonadaceae bacterium]